MSSTLEPPHVLMPHVPMSNARTPTVPKNRNGRRADHARGRRSAPAERARRAGRDGPCHIRRSSGAVVVEAAARMAPERAAALVLLDGSLAEDGSAEPETPRSGRRARLLVAALRSRPAVAAWRVCGPTILTLTVPARRSLARSVPGLRDEMASISVLETCLHELSAYSSCVRQLHALRTTSPLTPQLPTLVVAANGRLQRRTPTRWVRAVLRQAREIAADADVRKAVLERSGHFVMLDRPQRMADLILTLGSR